MPRLRRQLASLEARAASHGVGTTGANPLQPGPAAHVHGPHSILSITCVLVLHCGSGKREEGAGIANVSRARGVSRTTKAAHGGLR